MYGEEDIMLIRKYKNIRGNKKIFVDCILLFAICACITEVILWCGGIIINGMFSNGEINNKYKDKVVNEVRDGILSGRISRNTFGELELQKISQKYKDVHIRVEMQEVGSDTWETFYSSGFIILSSDSGEMYCSFNDGARCRISVMVFEERKNRFLLYKNIACIFGGLIFYIIIVVSYIVRMQKKISKLKAEIGYIEGGDLSRNIGDYGDDDVEDIAKGIEQLKKGMIISRDNEMKAVDDKNNMARNLAHDIRTPITVILGNLELIQMGLDNNVANESLKDNINICMEKIDEIKKLTSEVFSNERILGEDMNRIKQQYIDKLCEELNMSGFKTVYNCIYNKSMNILLQIKPNQFKRVINNITSNISKYADKGEQIIITLGENFIIIKNSMLLDNGTEDNNEHNYIGTGICEDIMKQMNGTYIKWEDDNCYYQKITFEYL